MRNKFIVLAISSLLLCNTAFADTTLTEIVPAEGIVTIKGKTDSEVITYKVYDKDIEKPAVSDIVGMGEEYPENSEFLFTFGLKEGGSYEICIFDGTKKISDEFEYASSLDREKFAEKVTEILKHPETAADKLAEEFLKDDNVAVINTIGIGSYLGHSEAIQEAICKKMAEDGANKTYNEKTLLSFYNEVETVVRMNKKGTSDAKAILDKLNYSFEKVAHKDIKNASQKTWIEQSVAENAPYEALTEIEKMYSKACALYEINNAKISNIKETVTGYASLLEITDESEYEKYLDKASSTVNRKLIEALDENDANTVKLLLEALDTATEGSKGSSGGSGGGGGRTSATGANPTPGFNYAVSNTEEEQKEPEKVEQTSIFSDVSASHWAYDAISALKAEGIVAGYGDGSFSPDRTVTREEYVKMIVAAFGLEDENAKSHFHDVFDSDWFYPYVSAAFEKGIVMGDDLGLFGVHADITRQDASVIAARVMKLAGISAETKREYTGFNDEDAISDYAKEDIKTLYCAGKINGTDTGSFEPQRHCTRAEAAAIIYGISR